MSTQLDTKYLRLVSSRLRNFKQKREGLFNFSCSFCGDSKKDLSKARGYAFSKSGGLFIKCHNCGVGTNIANLLKSLDPSLHKEYLLESYSSGRTNNAHRANTTINITPPKFGKLKKQKVFEHAEWLNMLPEGHFCLNYVKNRKLPSDAYDKLLFTSNYKKFVDTLVPNHGKHLIDDARLVIPFYDENDELIAISGRALETSDKTLRYVTIRTNDSESKLIYGLDRIILSEKVLLVEGPIDSLFLNNCLASGDANLEMTSKSVPAKDIVLVYDNERRNREIVNMMQKSITNGHQIVIWPNDIYGKDINEMVMSGLSCSEIQTIISNSAFSGIEAQLKFNMWKRI
jgi:hypothetical protein